jgi:hypothetical protein
MTFNPETHVSAHFTRAEMACSYSGAIIIEPGFTGHMEQLRISYDAPMIVTSGCRSSEHNHAIGGHPRSLHMTENAAHGVATCAIDIKREGLDLHKLIRIAAPTGWSIGIADTFIHLDQRTALVGLAPRIWTY